MGVGQPHRAEDAPTGRSVEQLLNELASSGSVRFSVLSSDRDIYLTVTLRNPPEGPPQSNHAMEFWVLESDSWIAWLRVSAVSRMVFVRGPDPHAPGREALSVRFLGSNTTAFLRAAFTPLYDEDGQPMTDQFAAWENLRERYGGRSELMVAEGTIRL